MNKLILITGGSASGKTHLAKELVRLLGENATYLSQDSFYILGGDESRNYDLPDALDFSKQKDALSKLLNNQETEIPIYDFSSRKVEASEKVKHAPIIVFEGLFVLHDPEIRNLADFKIFVDTPADTRLARRILRDTEIRGRDINSIIMRWLRDVQPSYNQFISPKKKEVDVIIPWHKINEKSLKALIATILNIDSSIEDLIKKYNI